MEKGKVYLVGAGPGDPGLLTVKGLWCIRHADVIIYDYLASSALLNEADENAELIYAGKRSGHHHMSQTEIQALLLEKAFEGKAVLRLKGGDPFIFGWRRRRCRLKLFREFLRRTVCRLTQEFR